MNVLLLNITRFGDLLQSQSAVNALTAQGHRAAMVCLGNFIEAGALLRGLDHVFPFRSAALLKSFDANWREALADLSSWRDDLLTRFKPDLVCNLTPSLPARMLSLFLSNGGEQRGFAVDGHGYGFNGNAWAAFLQGAASSREVSPFNIVDVFRMMAAGQNTDAPRPAGDAALKRPSSESRARMGTLLANEAPQGCRGFIALQLGASEERRRWPTASFAALGDIVWEQEGLCPVLLGSSGEKALAEKYGAAAAGPYISLCGRTGLEELAAALTSMRMLVTNDTGTMHLAAGLGVPILSFFLATAQAFDTGPYLAGSCCLEPALDCHPCAFGSSCPHNEACRRAIKPEAAASLALSYLRAGDWRSQADMAEIRTQARVWLSVYDERGFMSLRSLSGHDAEARTAWLTLQRRCLHPYLAQEGPESLAAALSGLRPTPQPEAEEIAKGLRQMISLVDLMLQQGKTLQARPIALMRERFLGSWRKIHSGLRENPWFGSLSLLWSHETQMDGQDLPGVLERAERFAALLRTLEQGLAFIEAPSSAASADNALYSANCLI